MVFMALDVLVDAKGLLTFPDSAETENGFLYATVGPNCRNRTFCEHTDNYPEKLFQQVLKNEKQYSQFFRNLEKLEPLITRDQKNNQNYVCLSRKSVVYPKVAYNMKNELKFIYNLDRYKQGVSVDVCVRNQKCKFYDNVKKFKTMCRQKFVEKLLLTADADGKPYVDRYRFPSACVCSYKSKSSSYSPLKFYG
ncbi:protein spaetzle-like [Tribolium madens]|uniref:protein spaetzle-like n=1 Tax=Tribolium madens TaxID=41895 RepID=UPI001CF75F87|nr:protein spaetzle-like [Tribolium madens]